MARLKDLYKSKIIQELTKEFGYKNSMAVPRMEKVIISMGIGKATQDKKFLESAKKDLIMIAGQMPIACKAKKSVSNFKVRTFGDLTPTVSTAEVITRWGLASRAFFLK